LSDEPVNTGNNDGKKKVNPVFFVGPAVAIGASLLAVMISTSNGDKADAPAAGAPDEIATIQSTTPGQPAAPGVPVPPEPGAATASADGAVVFADQTLNYTAAFPPAPADDPVLRPLRAEAQAYLEKSKADAREDFQQRKQMGATEMAWEVKTQWKYTAKAGGIVSLQGEQYQFTGGAHGMSFTDTHIARAGTGEAMTFDAMLQDSRSPSPALVIGICEALKKAKLEAINSATIFDEPIVCAGPNANVKIEEAKIALAPSTEADRFGGVFVYFDPYAVGAYAEGPYTLTIPQEVFREDLRKEFQPLFAGSVSAAQDN
jgi:hypothetical protein